MNKQNNVVEMPRPSAEVNEQKVKRAVGAYSGVRSAMKELERREGRLHDIIGDLTGPERMAYAEQTLAYDQREEEIARLRAQRKGRNF